jgi:hypothetical protein
MSENNVSVSVERVPATVTITVTEDTARKINFALEEVEDFYSHADLVDLSEALDAEGFTAASTESTETEHEASEEGDCGCGSFDDEDVEDERV